MRPDKNLVEIASHFTTLRKAGGGNLKGTCPFCQDRFPTFQVSPTKQLWHCFSCQEGGDLNHFVGLLKQ